MIAWLNVCMGGRVAQELIFAEDEVTLGAFSDLECAMDTKYGKSMSTKTRLLIKKEVRELLEFPFNNDKNILTTHINEHHMLAYALLDHETLSGKHIKEMFGQLKSELNQQQHLAQL
ncbi:putative peptidase M41 [Helianthus annuus]|nr:putative peptidase M41 [Helianthus annuus]